MERHVASFIEAKPRHLSLKKVIAMAIIVPSLMGGLVGVIKSGSFSPNSSESETGYVLSFKDANPWDVLADFQAGPQKIKPPETGNAGLH